MPPPSPTLDNSTSLISALNARIHRLEAEVAQAKKQEAITHDALHAWRNAASAYHTALAYIETLYLHLVSDGHSPQSACDQIRAFVAKTLAAPSQVTKCLDEEAGEEFSTTHSTSSGQADETH